MSRQTRDNRTLIRSGETPVVGWSRQMLYSGFNILPRSVFWSAYLNGRSDNLDVIQTGQTYSIQHKQLALRNGDCLLHCRCFNIRRDPRSNLGDVRLLFFCDTLPLFQYIIWCNNFRACRQAGNLGKDCMGNRLDSFLLPRIIHQEILRERNHRVISCV